MDVRELVVAGIDGFTEKVRAVPDDRWDAPTPCTEWSVRDLVNHMTSEHLWAPHLLRGETLDQVGDRYDGDVLGDDPVDVGAGRGCVRAMWLEVAPGTPVHLSSGPTPVEEYAEQMRLDLVVHGWDLARGAGSTTTSTRSPNGSWGTSIRCWMTSRDCSRHRSRRRPPYRVPSWSPGSDGTRTGIRRGRRPTSRGPPSGSKPREGEPVSGGRGYGCGAWTGRRRGRRGRRRPRSRRGGPARRCSAPGTRGAR